MIREKFVMNLESELARSTLWDVERSGSVKMVDLGRCELVKKHLAI